MSYQKLTDSEALAFRAVFPHESKWLDFLPAMYNQRNDTEHLADQHRAKKRLVGELRAMTETAQNEKRELTDSERRAFEAASKIIENLDQSLFVADENERNNRRLPGVPGIERSTLGQPEKIIFRHDEKISDFKRTTDELRSLSVGRMMNILVNGAERTAASDKELRALQEGINGQGGYTVPITLLSQFIDKMRAKSVCQQAGAQTVLLDSNKVSIAKLATDPAAGWRLELGAVATGDPTFEQVQFVAKSLACMVRVSRELLADTLNAGIALENALAQALALEVDRACLFGAGVDPQPKGITLASGIQTLSVGGANGGQLTNYAPLIQGLQKLAEANAEPATALVMAPRTKFGLAGLIDTTNQPLNSPAIVAAVPQLDSTSVPVNMTKGTATNATKIILGDFSQMLLGVRQSLEIEVSKEKFIDTLEVAFIAHLRFDVQFAHTESFCVIDGIIP